MLKSILAFCPLVLFNPLWAQEKQDSIPVLLPEVVIKAYEQNRDRKEVSASVHIIDKKKMERFGIGSLVPAVNAAPGIKMEERSPGSYRLNIRGSSLRSPFGVRNVKIYLNDVPYTDPGGGTYLNQLSFFDIAGIEIIKGPGSSLYGAGTGGVMLIKSMTDSIENTLQLNYARGSYNTNHLNVTASDGNNNFQNQLSYTHQTSDGYRDQSAMRRDLISWQAKIKGSDRRWIETNMLFGDLYYQTPGGLTEAQYRANPKAARSATALFPGAQDVNAAIYQKTFRASILQSYQFDSKLENKTSVYGAFSQIRNSAILNYERRLEPHFGARSTFSYTTQLASTQLKIVGGAEFQQGYFTIKVYKNNAGNADSLRTDDEVNNRQLSLFSQATFTFPGGWIASAGISYNKTAIGFSRLSQVPTFNYKTSFRDEWAPRISLLKKVTKGLSIYGILSKGFSPPTVSELLPSTTIINTNLEAEEGMNYEAGIKGEWLAGKLRTDISVFNFGLRNAITQRRDASGADYFINAGNTSQRGVEAALSYELIRTTNQFITSAILWINYTLNHFRYKEFKQADNNYSGNEIPGIAPNTIAGGLDIITRPGIYLNLTYSYNDQVALNDANSAYAGSYQLPGFRIGYRKQWGSKFKTDLFVSGDNLLNEQYGLGNDINAAGNRYYNAAAGINVQAGIRVQCF